MIDKDLEFLKTLNDGLTAMFDTLSDIQDLMLAHAQWLKKEAEKLQAELTEKDAEDVS